MATSKEIEKILGIPHRTVETWSRTRDDRYLLVKFLKSFSAFDLEERMEKILKQEDLIKKNIKEFTKDLMENPLQAGIIHQPVVSASLYPRVKDMRIVPDMVMVTKDHKLSIVEIIPLLSSRPHTTRRFELLEKYAAEYTEKNDLKITTTEIILITKSRLPRFIEEDASLSKMVKVYDLDEVTKNLYGSAAILV